MEYYCIAKRFVLGNHLNILKVINNRKLTLFKKTYLAERNISYFIKTREKSFVNTYKYESQAIAEKSKINFYHTTNVLSGRNLMLDEAIAAREIDEDRKFPFPLLNREFVACQDLYLMMATQGENVPVSGLNMNVAYIDTAPHADSRTPVVVFLHGAPGRHTDFRELITYLSERGIRVIAPNFPGYGLTPMDRQKLFRHSMQQKAAFVKDFLDTLQVSRVDVVVGHSAGCYPAAYLCSRYKLVRSLVLLNSGGHRHMKVLQPKWFFDWYKAVCRNNFLRPIVLLILKGALILVKYGNKNVKQMSVAMETLADISYDEMVRSANDLRTMRFPMTLIYSKDDRVVEHEMLEELAEIIGCPSSRIELIDSSGKFIKKIEIEQNPSHYVRAVRLDKASHFVMKKFPDIVNNYLMDILNHVQNYPVQPLHEQLPNAQKRKLENK